MLAVGIIGLPNTGKSTLFNLLTAGDAEVSAYPFTTIDGNVGMVPVPDPRLERLRQLLEPEETTPCRLRFVDIAGLVAGAHKGEGLGNRFLGEIRKVDVLAHVLRCFASPEVAHVTGTVDPVRDAGIVETELALADLELVEKAVEKRRRQAKSAPAHAAAELERLAALAACLERGEALRSLGLDEAAVRETKALGLLTGKPQIYVANIGEEQMDDPEGVLAAIAGTGGDGQPPEAVAISAKIEWELLQLDADERAEFMSELGILTSGLDRLVEASFRHLGLIRFYTVAHGKLRAWEITDGSSAGEAAGRVHTDMERGFVRAQVTGAEELLEAGSLQELHRHGRLRTEGRGYRVVDGDVIEFLFT
ncbi:MAG: redox-regulated ATPase YchF [Thermoanaerobaculia bacterium]